MIRYCGLYSNAHRGKMHPPIIEDDPSYVPAKGWAEMIRKVYEIDPLLCPSCGGRMSVVSLSGRVYLKPIDFEASGELCRC